MKLVDGCIKNFSVKSELTPELKEVKKCYQKQRSVSVLLKKCSEKYAAVLQESIHAEVQFQ